MAAEDAAIRMELVEHDELQVLEQPCPFRVMGKDPLMQHVGIAEDDVSPGPHGGTGILGRIAVI